MDLELATSWIRNFLYFGRLPNLCGHNQARRVFRRIHDVGKQQKSVGSVVLKSAIVDL